MDLLINGAFCIGSVGHAAIGLPVELLQVGCKQVFKLLVEVRPTSLAWLPLTDLDGWFAQPVQWFSPWCPPVGADKKGNIATVVRAQSTGDPQPLLRYAASNAFWKLPVSLFDKHVGIPWPFLLLV